MAARGGQEGVSLDSLNPQQLTQVKKQLDDEVEHLTNSFAQLHAAQGKFKECLRCVNTAPTSQDKSKKKDILVPLTNSLYVRGKLTNPDRVIVDVGTGFYVEKDVKSATEFYEDKVKQLGSNIQDLENIVQNKTNSLRMVEEVLRQKVLAGSQPGPSS
ncbi:c-myc binding protein [Phialemonium atrogriseum]|uniref:C-myc binding protein n=1 Tax=Phialemonium atrogriseum TaxID=1093897 RepID=A0AAJ0C4R6_9PEZI|nr:c-myc binding protein [Phialemonium atrogriseum]KAK1769906.1 c-myc binding protein [Phialemonium atrogriseum]